MLKNYLSVAFRNLIKHKFYSLINILGLSIGLTCFLMIALFVKDELSYDLFHSDIENMYRMDFEGSLNGTDFTIAVSSAPAGYTLVDEYPEVVDGTRLRGQGKRLMKRKNTETNYDVENVTYADANFFQFFDFKLLNGDVETCLQRPQTLTLSQSVARKLFADEDPIGQTVVMSNNSDWEVTGVFEDMPANSHMNFDMILAMEGLEESKSKFWMSFNFHTYFKLQDGYDPMDLEAKFPALIEKYIGPEVERFMGVSMKEFEDGGNRAGFFLFPVKDIHLYSAKDAEVQPNGDIKYVYIFTAIALFILVLACINFMNLSTARSAGRAKEVGVRKVMGAFKAQLIRQFLTEAFMITFISIVIAYSLSFLVLPYFNQLAGKEIEPQMLFTSGFLGIIGVILLVVGLLAGSYPAFYLSKFRPVEVLKGKLNLGLKSGGLRGVLVVLQFTVSIVMIIGTAIVYQQLSYIQNKKLGFSKEQLIMIHDPWLMGDKAASYRDEILQNTNVKNGTISSFLPVKTTNNNSLWFPGQNPTKDESYVFHNYRIDQNYLETLDIELVEGRGFSREFPSDSAAVVLNETAVQQLGWDKAVGERISTYGGSNNEPVVESYKVIGVVTDFHFTSLRDNIEPLVFMLGERRGFVSFKLSTENISETIDFIEAKWDEFAPGQPFAYSFLDERFSNLYKSEQKLGQIFGVFAFLAIFIACLGLYGLAAFTAEQKTKEIGVRKVLGASIASIINLLSKEFLKLVLISFVIGSAVSYYLMYNWLQDFQNRTDINILVFVLAGITALVIAWVTMSFQSWNAARVNPAKSLKDE